MSTYPFQIPSGVNLVPQVSGASLIGSASHPFSSVYTQSIVMSGAQVTSSLFNAKDEKSTGAYSFSGVTLASPTTFNVPEVKGWITLNTGPVYGVSPLIIPINYSGATNLSTPYLATDPGTALLIDQNSNLVMQPTFPTNQQRRENIFIAKIGHSNNTVINGYINAVDYTESPMNALRDMFDPTPLINSDIAAIPYSGLGFAMTSGTLHGLGINFTNNILSPNVIDISGTSPTTFFYRTQTGSGTNGNTLIDPTKYDVSGTITSIGATHPGQSTNQRIYVFPNNAYTVQYGQQVYNSLSEAMAGQQTETFTKFSNVNLAAVLVCVLAIRQDATDLNDTSQARFIPATRTGESVGGVGQDPSAYNVLYTSLLDGGAISQNGVSGINISAGSARFVDNHTDVNNPTVTNLSWVDKSGINLTSFLTAPRTFIAIDISGNVYQKPTVDFTDSEDRHYVSLGRVAHTNGVMTGIVPHAAPGYDSYLNALDFISVIGPLNANGNVFSAYSTDMRIAKSAGNTYSPGVNIQIDKSAPNLSTDPLASPLTTISYRYRSITPGVFTAVSATGISSASYDDGTGTLASLPSNRFTIQRIFYAFGNNLGTQRAIIMHGQNLYNNLAAAEAAIFSEPFTYDTDLAQVASFRAWLIIRGGTTDLADTTRAQFISAGIFGLSSSVGVTSATTDLQTAYNNSTSPEIVTDATRDGLTMKEGIGVGLNLYEGLNSSGNIVFSVSASGNVGITGITTIGNAIIPSGSGNINLGSSDYPFSGVFGFPVMQSPNGSLWRLTIDNAGVVSGVSYP